MPNQDLLDGSFLSDEEAIFTKKINLACENQEDFIFWEETFLFLKPHLKFESDIFSRNQGKNYLKNQIAQNKEKATYWICLDSDLDYLVDKNSYNRRYIFQTYVYSLESLCCFATNLEHIVKKCSFVACEGKIEQFCEKLSEILYPLVLAQVYEQKKWGKLRDFSDKNISFLFENTNDIANFLKDLEEKMNNLNISLAYIQEIEQKLIENQIEIKPKNAYLFFDGHRIEAILEKYLQSLINENKKSYKENLEVQAKSEYENKTKEYSLKTLLKTNYKEIFVKKNCFWIEKISGLVV